MVGYVFVAVDLNPWRVRLESVFSRSSPPGRERLG